MSLVFEALARGGSTEPQASPLPLAPGTGTRAAAAGAERWRGIAIGLVAGATLAGTLAWLLKPAPPAAVPAQVPAAPYVATPAMPVASVHTVQPAPRFAETVLVARPAVVARVPEVPPVPATVVSQAAAPPPAAPGAAAASPPSAAQAQASPASAPAAATPVPAQGQAARVQASTVPASFDVLPVFEAFLREMQLGQLQQAQSSAERISAALGPGHVMSLRAHGFLALRRNELPAARAHYLQLQELLPDDREAGLNLALVEWRLGDREAAQGRVARLLARHPDDPQVRALSLNLGQP